jgi:hypothetical protein
MSTATELLRRALDWIEYDPELVEEIRAFLDAEPATRKPMTEEEITKLFPGMPTEYEAGFRDGIDFAEKHHGIGGDDNG